MKVQGSNAQEIARQLVREQIPTPRSYTSGAMDCGWRRETVRAILKNEAYIGNTVQMKQERVSYRDRRQRTKPAEMWVRVEGTHMPIIERDVWDAVRAMDRKETLGKRVRELYEDRHLSG